MKNKILLTSMLFLIFSVAYSQSDPEYFANRSTTAGPDIESSKENIPVKKETFAGKLQRYKDNGFKVAVVLSSGPIKTKPINPNSPSTLTRQLVLKGNIPSMKNDFTPLVENFVAKMNNTFETDLFEIVDMKKIPYKESKFGKIDNWEITKYKMVIVYNISPQYDYSVSGTSTNEYTAKFIVHSSAPGHEYVNTKKGVKTKFPIRMGNMGFYTGKSLDSKSNLEVKTVQELHDLVNPITGADLVVELQKLQDEKIVKYINALKK